MVADDELARRSNWKRLRDVSYSRSWRRLSRTLNTVIGPLSRKWDREDSRLDEGAGLLAKRSTRVRLDRIVDMQWRAQIA
jgi:hypothetical protein